MMLRKKRARGRRMGFRSTCDCGFTTSSLPVVNEILLSDWRNALAHNMEIETWTAEELESAFGIDMDNYEIMEVSWRNSWNTIGDKLNCLLDDRIAALPESAREQLADKAER